MRTESLQSSQRFSGQGVINDRTNSFSSIIYDIFRFALQWLRSPKAVGTPFACSSFVAEEILKNVSSRSSHRPRQFLEIGPGLGAFTSHFISKMGPDDILDLVEIEEAFCAALRERYKDDKRVRVHCQSITDWKPGYLYDHIVTAVPLNALDSPGLVESILGSYHDLQKDTGKLSAVEYVGTTAVKSFFMCKNRRSFDKVIELKRKFFADHQAEPPVIVWKNLPPARVFHCKKI